MRRPFHCRFVAIGLVCLGAALASIPGCGSSEQPEAYPGTPINPPSKQDDLLDMMTGTGTHVATAETATPPTATPTATATSAPTGTPTGTPTAKPKSTATPTAKPTATPTAKPTATPTAKPTSTSPEMTPKKK